jgi:hypothetical protein
VLRELALSGEALDAGDLGNELGGGERAAADELEQLSRPRFEERLEPTLEPADASG